MVVPDDVVRAGDPDGCRGLVSVEQTPRAADVDNEVALNEVLGLCGILDEDGMAHGVVGDVVLYAQVVHTVDGHSSVEGVMDGVVAHVRCVHSADHMEVNRVGT